MESDGSVPSNPMNVDDYDPMADPKRRAKSNDPGWKYGYWTEPGNRDKVTCNLCKTNTTGGIKRLKEHLAGGYGDVLMCANTTTAIRKEMRAYLEKNKRHRPISIDEDDEQDDGQQGQQANQDSTTSINHPSSGTAAKKRRSMWTTTPESSKSKEKETTKVADKLRRTPEQIVDERRSGSYQPSIEATTKSKADREYVNKQWAMWFYECGVPFNAINARQFQIACEATAQYGSGYVPPSMHELREPLLKECVKDVASMKAHHEQAWKTYGCTLMSDGWTDKRGRHLINFLVNSPEGTYFMESVDASGEVHNASMLADLLERRINIIGRDNVVQVVTDNGANYKAAGELLMLRFPTLFWSPCAAHCLDLMLEDIGKLKEFKKPIAQAKRVTTFIYRHGKLLHAMREKTGGDLVRPAATRFATCFLTLKSLHKHRDALRSLFVSDTWNYNKLAKTEAGKGVCDIILAKTFWTAVEDCLRASAPLLIVLRAVDADERPAMAEVVALMDMAKEKIKAGFTPQNKQALLKKILAIVEKRWVSQMDHPLYGAALYLNPGKFFAIKKKGDDRYVGELRSCFNDVLLRMEPDEAIRRKIDDFAMDYEEQRGPTFSNKMAIANIEFKSPRKYL